MNQNLKNTQRFNVAIIILTFFSGIFIAVGCGKKSVNDLYKFPAASSFNDIQVEVNLDYKLDAGGGPKVTVGQQDFLLNAFVLDGEQKQIELGYVGQAQVTNLPVTLIGTKTVFDVTLHVPQAVKPGPNGYAFYFSLKEKGLSFSLSAEKSTVKNLDSLKGGVEPGAAAAQNKVPLSLATTLAYRFASDAGVVSGSAASVKAFEAMLTTIGTRLKLIESRINTTTTPDLETFASAVLAGLKLELLNDLTLQASLVESLSPAVKEVVGDSSQSKIASSFTALLKVYVAEVKTALGQATTDESKLFNSGAIDVASIPDPATYVSVVYAPTAVAFTDVDTTVGLGGNVVVSPPASTGGIESYALYFGGEAFADAKGKLVTTIQASANPLRFVLPNGTELPAAMTRFWVFPVVAGKELPLARSVLIVNVIENSTPTVSVNAPLSLVASPGSRRVTSSWASGSANTAGYVLVRKLGSAVTWRPTAGTTYSVGALAGTDEVIAYIGAATSFVDTNLAEGNYYYSVFAATAEKAYSAPANAPAALVAAGMNWTWIGGPSTAGSGSPVQAGAQGTYDAANTPGVRYNSITCGQENVVYLFGGMQKIGQNVTADLWKYNGSQWARLSGDNTHRVSGVYGTKGTADAANHPGSRQKGGCWIDNQGVLWLFGGQGTDVRSSTNVQLNDTWKYEAGLWTWVAGGNNCSSNGCAGAKGTLGVPAASNSPTARERFAVTSDRQGQGWIFGGYDGGSYQAELWHFNGTAWALVQEHTSTAAPGIYGTKGTPNAANRPGKRNSASLAADENGNLYLFGGEGVDSTDGTSGWYLDDLWKFDGSLWTWIGGSKIAGTQAGVAAVHGTLNTAAGTNTPGGHTHANLWADAGKVWLFGGDNLTTSNFQNHLMAFSDGQWTWFKGADMANQAGDWGALNTAATSSTPGARAGLTSWVDSLGYLHLFGAEPAAVGFTSFCFLTGCWDDTDGKLDFWKFSP